MSYDGPEPDFNTSLNGIDEFVVAESDWGVDNKKINELIHNPKSNKYTIKPISRSLLFGSSEFTDTNTFFKSEEPIETLEAEFDWCVKRKNLRLALLGTFTIILAVTQIELAYDTVEFKYNVGSLRGMIIKGIQSFLTLVLMFMIWDYYEYQVVGIKKNWYVQLYNGKRPGNLPRNIMSSTLWASFIIELLIIFIHVPPGVDFRYWTVAPGKTNVNPGLKKPFISDKLQVFMCLRLYLWIRVIRDHSNIYERRRLVYQGGFRERGGSVINYKLAVKKLYLHKEALSVFVILFVGVVILSYCTFVSERDYQPAIFTMKNSIWFTIFQSLLCGYNSMGAKTEFGQLVSIFVMFFGIIVLSLAIAVVFNCLALTSNETYALDWLQEYMLKEKERNAATDYLAYWWRYLAVKQATDMPPDEQRKLQSEYYSAAVNMFNKMSGASGDLAALEDHGDNSAEEYSHSNSQMVSLLKTKTLGIAEGADEVTEPCTAGKLQDVEFRVAALEGNLNSVRDLLQQMLD